MVDSFCPRFLSLCRSFASSVRVVHAVNPRQTPMEAFGQGKIPGVVTGGLNRTTYILDYILLSCECISFAKLWVYCCIYCTLLYCIALVGRPFNMTVSKF
jgi:hypothetical protein